MRPHPKLASIFVGVSMAALSACGGPPPAPPAAPAAHREPPPLVEAPPDLSPVAEPAGLVLVGRVSKADAILKTLGSWTRLPLPGGADLVRSITDDSVADAVDLSQPIDGAIMLGGSTRDPKLLIALSVPVRSFDEAKTKLSNGHRLTKGRNGQLNIEGIGRSGVKKGRGLAKGEEADDDGETCVLAPAPSAGARLVCGERDAIDALAPYLTRTVTLQKWTSDVHIEVSPAAVREPLAHVRTMLPVLARNLLGTSSPALAQIVDAGVNELVDFVGDTGRMYLDAQLGDDGMQTTVKIDYQKSNSLLAKLATSNPQKADVAPAAFWHLPADTDVAMYSKGSDPKLFDHPRELLGNVALEATQGAGMPEAERKAVRDLIVDRMMGLLTGPLVYGKGYDAAAVDKAFAARNSFKGPDLGAKDETERVLSEQALGWHLLQVTDPITKVGPMLKDWAQLWNRPAFAKWAKLQSSSKMLAQMRIVPAPAGVPLPKDAVHLEIVLPRPDIEESTITETKPSLPRASGGKGQAPPPPPAPLAKGKKFPRKPIVIHVLAVPDQGATWIGFGLDGKLLAQKAASALSTAPDAATLAKAPGAEALRDVKANGAWLASVRGFLVFTALEHGSRAPYSLLGSLPAKGTTPIVFSFLSQGPSQTAAGGSAVATMKLPRGAIEDIVKLVMAR
jgi:hypothetical protein